MIQCFHCGCAIPEGSRFCPDCGEPVTAKPAQQATLQQTAFAGPSAPQTAAAVKKRRSRIPLGMALGALLVAAVVAVLAVLDVISFGKRRFEGSGFDTAEQAARSYAEALADLDLDDMIATFAIEHKVEGYDPEQLREDWYKYFLSQDVDRNQARSYAEESASYWINYESSNTLLFQSALQNQISCITEIVRAQFLFHALRGKLGGYDVSGIRIIDGTRFRVSGSRISEIQELLADPNLFSSVQIRSVTDSLSLLPEDVREYYSIKVFREPYMKSAGIREERQITVCLTIDGMDYRIPLIVACFDDGRWYNTGFDERIASYYNEIFIRENDIDESEIQILRIPLCPAP